MESFRALKQFEVEVERDRAITSLAARELEAEVKRQIQNNFNNPSPAFSSGVKVHLLENASYVRLSPILSSHAERSLLTGNPYLWILLPAGASKGFRRIGKGFTWSDIKRKYGNSVFFTAVKDGFVVLYRDRSSNKLIPIYKVQRKVTTTKRIEFYEKGEEIADRFNLSARRTDFSSRKL